MVKSKRQSTHSKKLSAKVGTKKKSANRKTKVSKKKLTKAIVLPKKRGRPRKLDKLKNTMKRGRPKKQKPSFPGKEPTTPAPSLPTETATYPSEMKY